MQLRKGETESEGHMTGCIRAFGQIFQAGKGMELLGFTQQGILAKQLSILTQVKQWKDRLHQGMLLWLQLDPQT